MGIGGGLGGINPGGGSPSRRNSKLGLGGFSGITI